MKSIFASKTFWLAVLAFLFGGLNEVQQYVVGDALNWVVMAYSIVSIILRAVSKKEVKVKTPKAKGIALLLLIACLLLLIPKAQAQEQPRLAFNIAYDTTGRYEALGSYTAYEIRNFNFLGLKSSGRLTMQLWAFAGASQQENGQAAAVGGGAFVLHIKAADNLYFNVGPKIEMDGERGRWKLLVGLSLN